ncbi:MAG TPA: hypothetical protein VHV10_02710 [Ktedonobacteraceae bacterium]|jgi:hypothetical protein|nr:hypothetical protein [Ktedonobacteraceae bacterium]
MSEEKPQPPRRVHIQNDGGPGYQTKITDADTGQFIDKIFHVRLVDLDVHGMPQAILWMHAPAVDVTVNAHIINVCPYCHAQKPDPEKLENDKFRLKLTVDDTDLDLSIHKLERLQKRTLARSYLTLMKMGWTSLLISSVKHKAGILTQSIIPRWLRDLLRTIPIKRKGKSTCIHLVESLNNSSIEALRGQRRPSRELASLLLSSYASRLYSGLQLELRLSTLSCMLLCTGSGGSKRI